MVKRIERKSEKFMRHEFSNILKTSSIDILALSPKRDGLGQGASGTVFKTHLITDKEQKPIAFKQYMPGPRANPELIRAELVIHAQLSHANIVTYYNAVTYAANTRYSGYTMEYCPGGSLKSQMFDHSVEMSWDLRTQYSREILTGIDYLHQNGIVHRDIKPDNVLISGEGHAKLCDFGFSVQFDASEIDPNNASVPSFTDTPRGSPIYVAPEIWEFELCSSASDMYAFGVLLYELMTRKEAWETIHDYEDFYPEAIQKKTPPGTIPSDTPPALASGYELCIDHVMRNRPTARGFLNRLGESKKSISFFKTPEDNIENKDPETVAQKPVFS